MRARADALNRLAGFRQDWGEVMPHVGHVIPHVHLHLYAGGHYPFHLAEDRVVLFHFDPNGPCTTF